ncbi:MAG: hypothetical protein AAGG07_13625, partial [Planctomycetota bacterium]
HVLTVLAAVAVDVIALEIKERAEREHPVAIEVILVSTREADDVYGDGRENGQDVPTGERFSPVEHSTLYGVFFDR